MRVCTWNVNNIRHRLPLLLAWLQARAPDIVVLKSWNGVAVLSRGDVPVEILRALPDDPQDAQARFIEVAVQGVIVAGLYLPNGNPYPGPKFDYKMTPTSMLRAAAQTRRCSRPSLASRTQGCSDRVGRMLCERSIRRNPCTPSGTTAEIAGPETLACALTTSFSASRSSPSCVMRGLTARSEDSKGPATMHPFGWTWDDRILAHGTIRP